MITKENYYKIIAEVDRSKLDQTLQKGADLVDQSTENGSDWFAYDEDETIRRVINEYFSQLSDFLNQSKKPVKAKPGVPESEIIDEYGKKDEPVKRQKRESQQKEREPKAPASKPAPGSKKRSLRIVRGPEQYVERISDDVRFIDRFVSMHNRLKSKNSIRLFIKQMHDAIAEKRIRKSSPYAEELDYIQDSLLLIHSKFRGEQPILVDIPAARLNRMLAIAGKTAQMLSVRFIKSYINLQGKLITNKQATNLHNRITKAIDSELLTEKDPYWKEITGIHMNLKTFVKKNRGQGTLVITERELNGLNGIAGIGSSGLSGFTAANSNQMMNSMDFVQMQFDKIGFTGKWLNFIGNPSRGFSVLVSAPPKFGKSILCTGWAGDMARDHGTVLYVAKEEGLDDTLKEKLEDVAHPNLTVSNFLPTDLRGFDFVFLDSITRLHLSPEDLNRIRAANPEVSFIFISQVTKSGKARGSNEFAHDVDCIIEFPEKGTAVQYGRFNQGGTMHIFKDHQNQ